MKRKVAPKREVARSAEKHRKKWKQAHRLIRPSFPYSSTYPPFGSPSPTILRNKMFYGNRKFKPHPFLDLVKTKSSV